MSENVFDRYEKGEISLGKAAELLDVSYSEMVEKLKEKDIKIRFGPETIEEAEKEEEIIRREKEDYE